MKLLSTVLVAGTILFGIVMVPTATAAPKWNKECRGYSPAKTVVCIASKQQPPGGTGAALAIWNCESGFGTESPHSDPYHGPFQYMTGTYAGQRAALPDVSRWFDLSVFVHDMRSNIILAVAWAAHNSWGPWSCAT